MIALIVIWSICIIGLLILLKNIKDEKNTKKTDLKYEINPLTKSTYSSYYITNAPKISNKENIEYKPELNDTIDE